MSTTVYQFGLLQPIMGEKEIDQQIYLKHQYYNVLIEIDRDRRELIREAQMSVPDVAKAIVAYEAADKKVEKLLEQKKLSKSHDGRAEPPPKGAIKNAQADCKKARTALREAKEKHKELLVSLYQPIDDADKKRRKEARAESGLYWGNYLTAEQAAAAATRATKPPKFKRWTGYGDLAVQLQSTSPLEADHIFGDDTRVRIDPVDPKAWDKTVPRCQRKKLARTFLRLRIGSTGPGNRTPIWGVWPLYMHRSLPLPDDANDKVMVKWVRVFRIPWNQRWKYRWKVQITLEVPDPVKWKGLRDKDGPHPSIVAVNLGWRKMDDGSLRAATWADDLGNVGELRLPADKFRERVEKANRIRGHRDKLLDKLRPKLVEHVPECSKWKSFGRFYKLEHSEDLPDDIVDLVAKWAYRDRHLWWYERGCRQGAIRHRRELYRLFALELAKNYPLAIIENYNMKYIVEDENRAQLPAYQRVEAAPSTARQIINSTVSRLGGIVINGESKLATQECHICSHGKKKSERWDAAEQVMHTCKGCGAEWDQDINNARVMLARAQAKLASGELVATKKPKRPARFHKRHKNGQQPTT